MKSIEVSAHDWTRFCEDFTRINHGLLLQIELLDKNGVRNEIARDMPLERIEVDQSDPCVDSIVLILSAPGKRRIEHRITDPFHVIVRPANGRTKVLELDGEEGTTLVSFHSGALAESVEAETAPTRNDVAREVRYL